MIYVFISHQQSDVATATRLCERLNQHPKIIAYVDALDPHLETSSDDITAYLQGKINESTHLMAVVSDATRLSWWVPFEIGIGTQHGSAISSYLAGYTPLPSYLRKWPYLSSASDLERYMEVAARQETLLTESFSKSSSDTTKARYANRFHAELRSALGQRG